jgi:hypothetical protein
MGGVFIPKGISVAASMTASIGSDGTLATHVALHVHFDVSPTWLEVAVGHLEAAQNAEAARIQAWKTEDADARKDSLDREFLASMQAITAAAIALDAYYAVIKCKIKLPERLTDTWRRKGTPRHTQVGEVIRRAFKLDPADTKRLKMSLREIFALRDRAVHPHSDLTAPIEHPELKVCVGVSRATEGPMRKQLSIRRRLCFSISSPLVSLRTGRSRGMPSRSGNALPILRPVTAQMLMAKD